jgi:hypothetical protein
MGNALLKENKGKKGSYTIRVKSDYAVPKRSLKEIVSDISKPIKRSSTACRLVEAQGERNG